MPELPRELHRALALAGVVQASFMAHQLAQHGLAAQDKLAPLVGSLFVLTPRAITDIYGPVARLRLGLQLMVEIIEDGTASPANAETMRYALSLLYLQGRLRTNTAMLEQIRGGIETVATTHPAEQRLEQACLHDLAQLYQNTVSQAGKRIQVRGDMRFLQNDAVADKVRVTLFAGIRAAVLWHQLGGRRWQLLLQRKQLLANARLLLSQPQL